MKRILAVLAGLFLFTLNLSAGVIPITGTIRQANGNAFNGSIRFVLSYSAARDTTSNNIVVAQMVEFRVQNGALPSTAKITPNDVLAPANTFYTAQYITPTGTRIAQNVFYITGSQFDIGSATPTPLTTSNISFAINPSLISYTPTPGSAAGTVNTALNLLFTNPINAQAFTGTDTFAKINAAIASSSCASGCAITDGKSLNSTETITSGGITITSKPIHLILNAVYTYAGTAVSGGLIHVGGLNASGTRLECNGYPQNIAYEQVNIAIPCGIKYTPSTSGPLLTINEQGSEAINDVTIENISFVANSNVTDPIQYAAVGNGMGAMRVHNVSIANSATSQSWSGYGIHLACNNVGASSNAQYGFFDIENVAFTGNGTAINSGAGGTTSGGIRLDPVLSGHNCGTFSTNYIKDVLMEGLTGTYGIYLGAVSSIDIVHPIINSNNFAVNGRGIYVQSGACGSGVNIVNPQMDDNDWSTLGGVVDIYSAGACGIHIIGGYLVGGSKATTHAEDHAIEFDASTISAFVEGVTITNMKTNGTTINTGAGLVRYCGNLFSVGNGAATEFGGSLTAMTGHGCGLYAANADYVSRMVNLGFSSGARAWDWDANSSGQFLLNMAGTPQMTFGATSVTLASSPIIPFNTASGANVPLLMDINGTQALGTPHTVYTVATLSGGGTATVTLTGNAIFNAAGTYVCASSDRDGVNAVQIANTSGSQFVVTGTASHGINVICTGY